MMSNRPYTYRPGRPDFRDPGHGNGGSGGNGGDYRVGRPDFLIPGPSNGNGGGNYGGDYGSGGNGSGYSSGRPDFLIPGHGAHGSYGGGGGGEGGGDYDGPGFWRNHPDLDRPHGWKGWDHERRQEWIRDYRRKENHGDGGSGNGNGGGGGSAGGGGGGGGDGTGHGVENRHYGTWQVPNIYVDDNFGGMFGAGGPPKQRRRGTMFG